MPALKMLVPVMLVSWFLVGVARCQFRADNVVFTDHYIKKEAKACFDYFWDLASKHGETEGLVQDKASEPMLSIAATGFGLAALPIGVENGWISRDEGANRASATVETLKRIAQLPDQTLDGFYYHFIDEKTGYRFSDTTEISTIDTTLLIAGAIVAGEYFGGDVKASVSDVYKAINWNSFLDTDTNTLLMAYTPESGYYGVWDKYAEHLMMYVLGVGAPEEAFRIPPSTFYAISRYVHEYRDVGMYIHSWFNSLFTYHFSHAYVDFRNLVDDTGVDWFQNSVTAVRTHYRYALDNPHGSATYGATSWGVTASETVSGYGGSFGVPPAFEDGSDPDFTTSIAPSAAISSMPFMPNESYAALKNYIDSKLMDSKYGLVDAYDLDYDWVAEYAVGINKGNSLLMLANYQDGFIWRYFMQNEYVKSGISQIFQSSNIPNAK